jgi:hypothetical protein
LHFGFDLVEGSTHLVFLNLLLLDLREGRNLALGNLVRVLQLILELLVAQVYFLLLRLLHLLRLLGPACLQRGTSVGKGLLLP